VRFRKSTGVRPHSGATKGGIGLWMRHERPVWSKAWLVVDPSTYCASMESIVRSICVASAASPIAWRSSSRPMRPSGSMLGCGETASIAGMARQ